MASESKTTESVVKWRCLFQIPSHLPSHLVLDRMYECGQLHTLHALLHLLSVCVINLGASSRVSTEEIVFLLIIHSNILSGRECLETTQMPL